MSSEVKYDPRPSDKEVRQAIKRLGPMNQDQLESWLESAYSILKCTNVQIFSETTCLDSKLSVDDWCDSCKLRWDLPVVAGRLKEHQTPQVNRLQKHLALVEAECDERRRHTNEADDTAAATQKYAESIQKHADAMAEDLDQALEARSKISDVCLNAIVDEDMVDHIIKDHPDTIVGALRTLAAHIRSIDILVQQWSEKDIELLEEGKPTPLSAYLEYKYVQDHNGDAPRKSC